MEGLQLIPLQGVPLVEPGDDLAEFIVDCLADSGLQLRATDVLVLAQKIVSKSEGRYVKLASVVAEEEALRLASEVEKDPRLVQLILDESSAVVRSRPGVIIVRHRLGYVHANAGIDRSNIIQVDGEEQVLLLPIDSDASAASLRTEIEKLTSVSPRVLINDSAGRAWRNGTVGMTLGSSGFAVIKDQIGEADLLGNQLEVTVTAVADELSAAASFVMGQGKEAIPVVLIRGAVLEDSDAGSEGLIRELEMDLFS